MELNTDKFSSLDMEMSVIGSVFSDDKAGAYCLSQLSEDDFTDKIYRNVFKIAGECYRSNGIIDRGIVYEELKRYPDIEKDAKREISKAVSFSKVKDIESYVERIKSYTFRRKALKSISIALTKANDDSVEDEDIRKAISGIADQTTLASVNRARTTYEILAEDSHEFVNLVATLKEFKIMYAKSGNGLGQTELIFGRPGHGKTYYLIRRITDLALGGSKGVLFHLEDSAIEAVKRVNALINPVTHEEENRNVFINEKLRYLDDIVQSVRYMKIKHDIKWFACDHLGKIRVRGYRAHEKNSAMIEVSNTLTDLANELGILGLFTVQPNKPEKGKRGWMNRLREEDLKGATEIFEDAFVVTTVFRPNQYPELRINGKVKDVSYKNDGGLTHHYDSVFISRIKDRREGLSDDMYQFIQDGDRIISAREHNRLFNSKTNITEEQYDDYVPF